jgi:hypothetical protein
VSLCFFSIIFPSSPASPRLQNGQGLFRLALFRQTPSQRRAAADLYSLCGSDAANCMKIPVSPAKTGKQNVFTGKNGDFMIIPLKNDYQSLRRNPQLRLIDYSRK